MKRRNFVPTDPEVLTYALLLIVLVLVYKRISIAKEMDDRLEILNVALSRYGAKPSDTERRRETDIHAYRCRCTVNLGMPILRVTRRAQLKIAFPSLGARF